MEYRVTSHTFLGSESHTLSDGKVYESYEYKITFNQSLVHTGRMKGIEDGLNAYVKKEAKRNLIESITDFWYCFVVYLKSLLK